MERRTFVGASAATLLAATTARPADPRPNAPEVYDLHVYTVKLKPANRARLDAHLSEAYLPALSTRCRPGRCLYRGAGERRSAGHRPRRPQVRRFGRRTAGEIGRRCRIPKESAGYFAAKADDPAYLHIDSSLLVAISGMPKLLKPDNASKPRLLNLRVYESHNERSAAKKVEMFETAELAIFRRTGLTPVFFASAWSGRPCPT